MKIGRRIHTGCLLFTIAGYSADDSILLSPETVDGTIGIFLGLGSLVLGLPRNVFLLARLAPRLIAGQVTDSLDGCALEGVELPRGLAIRREWSNVVVTRITEVSVRRFGVVVVGHVLEFDV